MLQMLTFITIESVSEKSKRKCRKISLSDMVCTDKTPTLKFIVANASACSLKNIPDNGLYEFTYHDGIKSAWIILFFVELIAIIKYHYKEYTE